MKQTTVTVLISAAVLWTSSATAQSTCSFPSTNTSNFNGTQIQQGHFIWFNANFSASGIPSAGATITFTSSTITFTADQPYIVNVPNAQITFSPSAVCAATTFDTYTNTWMTTVPLAGSDEIFLSGVEFPVPLSFAIANGRVQGSVVWQGAFASDAAGISVAWKWGAAVYTVLSADYNMLSVKPAHTNTCLYHNSDHAGTPEGVDPNSGRLFKDFVVGAPEEAEGRTGPGHGAAPRALASASMVVEYP